MKSNERRETPITATPARTGEGAKIAGKSRFEQTVKTMPTIFCDSDVDLIVRLNRTNRVRIHSPNHIIWVSKKNDCPSYLLPQTVLGPCNDIFEKNGGKYKNLDGLDRDLFRLALPPTALVLAQQIITANNQDLDYLDRLII